MHPVDQTTRFRFATLNLRREWNRWPERAPLVVAELARLQPDLIGLQEVSVQLDQARWIAEQVNSQLDGAPYLVYQQPAPGIKERKEAIAILSRWPVAHYELLSLGQSPFLAKTLTRSLRIAQRLRIEPRPGLSLDFFNTHLHYVTKHWLVRVRQVSRLLRWMSESDSADQILVGDLNDTPGSEPLKRINARLQSAYASVHGVEPAYTSPTPLVQPEPGQRRTLDYIFVSPMLRVLDAQLAFDQAAPNDETLYPSDHFGLVADVQIGVD